MDFDVPGIGYDIRCCNVLYMRWAHSGAFSPVTIDPIEGEITREDDQLEDCDICRRPLDPIKRLGL